MSGHFVLTKCRDKMSGQNVATLYKNDKFLIFVLSYDL